MTPPNIEAFNRAVALILATLYEGFPNPTILDLQALAPDATHAEHLMFGNTVDFLKNEGFMRFSSFADTGTLYLGCVLTEKGLSRLSVPKSLKDHVSVGTRLIQLAKVAGVPVASAELPALLRLLGL